VIHDKNDFPRRVLALDDAVFFLAVLGRVVNVLADVEVVFGHSVIV
jgi:hypothetical protein